MLSIPIHFTQNLYTPLPPRLGGFTSSPTPPPYSLSAMVTKLLITASLSEDYDQKHPSLSVLSSSNYSTDNTDMATATCKSPPNIITVLSFYKPVVPLISSLYSSCHLYFLLVEWVQHSMDP